MDLLNQFEALGYANPDKINGTFCNFPASIIRVRRTLRDSTNRDVYITVTTFMRDGFIIQIFMSAVYDTDQEIKDICSEI
jgi:DNA-binding winged helix-turn-helix (wHTH) protein